MAQQFGVDALDLFFYDRSGRTVKYRRTQIDGQSRAGESRRPPISRNGYFEFQVYKGTKNRV